MARNKISKWFKEYIPEQISDSSIFRFKITLDSGVYELDMRSDLDIDYSIIQDQLADIPSEFAYWSAIHSELKFKVAFQERRIKSLRGKISHTLLVDCIKQGSKPTDKQIQAAIEGDDQLQKLELELMILEKQCGKLYYMVEAIRMKAENLRSLSGFAKIEYGMAK